MRRNSKNLKWDFLNKKLIIKTTNFSVVCDETTEINIYTGQGYKNWEVYRPECFNVIIPANIARSLGKYTEEIRQEFDYDVVKISWK